MLRTANENITFRVSIHSHDDGDMIEDTAMSGSKASYNMTNLQPLQSQSSYRHSATLFERRPMMPHQHPTPTTRQRQISVHHLMHHNPPDILFALSFEHYSVQADLDLRDSADSVWQADTLQYAA